MKRANKVGVGRFVLRTKQYLAAVRPLGRALAISTMLYADEVVSQDELEGLPDAHVKPGERELKMAEQLIESLSADFDIQKYKDDYREQVLALIERKAAGEEIVAEGPAEEPRGKVVNLMEALQKSLAAAKRGELREGGEVRHKPEPEERAAARTARTRARGSRTHRPRGEEERVTSSQEVQIQGKRLVLSNLDKVLYPKAGFTKGQVLDYYLRIAPVLLPHLRDRP